MYQTKFIIWTKDTYKLSDVLQSVSKEYIKLTPISFVCDFDDEDYFYDKLRANQIEIKSKHFIY